MKVELLLFADVTYLCLITVFFTYNYVCYCYCIYITSSGSNCVRCTCTNIHMLCLLGCVSVDEAFVFLKTYSMEPLFAWCTPVVV